TNFCAAMPFSITTKGPEDLRGAFRVVLSWIRLSDQRARPPCPEKRGFLAVVAVVPVERFTARTLAEALAKVKRIAPEPPLARLGRRVYHRARTGLLWARSCIFGIS